MDTFEGLPEDWGTYNKGDMIANIPAVNDNRAVLIKGLFLDCLPGFLAADHFSVLKKKIIHLDADLFSSTLFALNPRVIGAANNYYQVALVVV